MDGVTACRGTHDIPSFLSGSEKGEPGTHSSVLHVDGATACRGMHDGVQVQNRRKNGVH